MNRVAMLSVHGCPVARLGERDTGGMNVYVLQTARALGEMGHRVDVYTRWHDPRDEQIMPLGENARVVHLKAGPYDRSKEDVYQDIPEFIDKLYAFQRSEDLSYDVVHSHYWLSGAAGLTLASEWDVPHVVTFHTLSRKKLQSRVGERESELRTNTETAIAGGVDAIIASTLQERDDLAHLYGVPPQRAHVIPPGVDTQLFRQMDRQAARKALGIAESKVVLSVGRIEPLKGLDILIRAVAQLEDVSDTRLLIVGGSPSSDPEVEQLRAVASEEGIGDAVTFTGKVDQAELTTYYNAADVFVLASYYESFGLVALEAMACGVPVIASRVGGPRTFIRDSLTGYLIPWQCPEPYAQRIEMLLSNPGLRASMGDAAREEASKRGWNSAARGMSGLYDSLSAAAWRYAAGA